MQRGYLEDQQHEAMRREHRSFSKKMLRESDEIVIDSRQGMHVPDAITKSTMLLSERPKNFKKRRGFRSYMQKVHKHLPEEHCLIHSVRVLKASSWVEQRVTRDACG